MKPRWKVSIERRSRTQLDSELETEFASEQQAKAFARARFARGCSVRVEASDGSVSVAPTQTPAWLLGSPKDAWPLQQRSERRGRR